MPRPVTVSIPGDRLTNSKLKYSAEMIMLDRLARHPRPLVALLAAAIVVAVAVGIALFRLYPLTSETAFVLDSLQQLVVISVATVALALAARSGTRSQRRLRGGVALAFAVTMIGIIAWNLEPGGSTSASPIADATFIVGGAIGLAVVVPALFGGLDRSALIAVGLDAAILFAGAATLVLAVWLGEDRATRTQTELLGLFAGAAVIAGSAAGVIALFAKRIRPALEGAWAAVAGLFAIALAWIIWLGMETEHAVSGATPAGFIFSFGAIAVAYGCVTWDERPSDNPTYARWATVAADILPIGAIVLAVAFVAVGETRFPWVAMGTGAVILLAVARQAFLLRSERRARADEQRAARRLADEVRERSDTIFALSRLDTGPTPEATARAICREALRLDGIDVAIVSTFTPVGDVVALAEEGIELGVVGNPLPVARGAVILERAWSGPWVQLFDAMSSDPYFQELHAGGLRGMVNAGLRWNDRRIGSLGLGTRSEAVAAGFEARLATVREFAVVAAALLGPSLAERDRATRVRESIQQTIDGGRFHPVFQPVLDLANGRQVGFEGLTRFHHASRPDLEFLDAASAGMAIPLETATLRASLDESRHLPAGRWLSLNVSPAMATALDPLRSLVGEANRDVVIEITEHAAIEDYSGLVDALGSLRRLVRIAVDDAGAGFAGLRHILELQPHFVKLDLALVRAIDSDPGKRAMVASMAAFARDTGCVLIAEGIETHGELAALRDLGVELGQGFLLGRPLPAGAFSAIPIDVENGLPWPPAAGAVLAGSEPFD